MRKAGKIALVVGGGLILAQAVQSELHRTDPAQTKTRVVQSDIPQPTFPTTATPAPVAQNDLSASSSMKILSVPSMLVGGDHAVESAEIANQQTRVLSEASVIPPSTPNNRAARPIVIRRYAPGTVAYAPRYIARPFMVRPVPTRVRSNARIVIIRPSEQTVYSSQPHGIRGFFANLGHKIHEKWLALRD